MTNRGHAAPSRGSTRRRDGGRRALAAGWVVCILLLAGCTSEPVEPAREAAPTNILLLSIDTLRADHLGCYGHPRATSPHLDRFARSAVLYRHARSPAPWTLPSHAAMLTGVHPWLLGIRDSHGGLPAEIPTLAEALAGSGYRTAAFVDSSRKGYVGGERGFSRGFAEFHHAPHAEDGWVKYDMGATVDAGLAWLESAAAGSGPFFLFLHTKSVHGLPPETECLDPRCFPYDELPPFRFRFFPEGAEPTYRYQDPERGWGQSYLASFTRILAEGDLDAAQVDPAMVEPLPRLYDAGIAYVDHQFGRLLQALDSLGLAESTAVVVTADHGEAFLDHGLFLHHEVYETLLRVPLLVRVPGADPGTVDAPVVLEDVAPTLLELAGVPVPAVLTGRQLPGPGEPPPPRRDHFAYYLVPERFAYSAFGLEVDGWKLVRHNYPSSSPHREELYDLRRDPGELAPLDDPRRTERLRRLLARAMRQPPLATPLRIDDEDEAARSLKALGYID